ncbi:MAG TPA: hypothetical protein VK783_09440 [Bacteroidia bacterium]|jgi:hypothetical protein|nr:hypothetical protein [Bacteroidia bacterium]
MKASLLFFAILFLSLDSFAQTKVKDTILANKIYEIRITETSSAHPNPWDDGISFKSGYLNSTTLLKNHQFSSLPYTASISSSDTSTVTFTSEGKNRIGDIIKWNGTITDSERDIQGTVVITHKNGKITTYSFTGKQKVKK